MIIRSLYTLLLTILIFQASIFLLPSPSPLPQKNNTPVQESTSDTKEKKQTERSKNKEVAGIKITTLTPSNIPVFNSVSTSIDSTSSNLIRNSSFETESSGQPRGWYYLLDSTTGNTFISPEGIRSGNFGLKFVGTAPGNFGIMQPDLKTVPGRTYTLSAYIKQVNTPSITFRFGLWNEYLNKEGPVKNLSLSTGTKDWTRVSFTTTTPGLITDPKNMFPILEIFGLSSGSVYIDDIQLEEGSSPSVYNSAQAKSSAISSVGDGSIIFSPGGDIYPNYSGLGSLGSSTNKFQSLTLSNAKIDKDGNLTVNGSEIKGTLTLNGNLSLKSGAVITLPSLSGGILHSDSSGSVSASSVNLANSDVTGTLPVANGGTGATSLTQYGILYGNGTSAISALTPGTSGYVLQSNGSSTAPSWVAAGSADSIQFSNITSGTNTSAAMVIGSGASLTYSGGTASSGVINTNQLLGNTWASPGSIGITTPNNGSFTTLSASSLDINGNLLVQGGGTIDTRSSGTLAIGNTTATTITLGRSGQGITIPGFDCSAQTNGGALTTTSGGVLTCSADDSSSTSNWRLTNGALSPINDTLDLLIGNSSTSSAKFAFLNVNSGTPTASISANSGNNALYLTGDGTLATTNRATLTIGNSSTYNTTGDILLNPNGTGSVGIGTTAPIFQTEIFGVGQLTSTLTDAGARTGMLALNANNSNAGAGGALLFGNNQSDTANSLGFAAIKGLLTNGNTNTTGDLAFSTRNTIADTSLTERMRILGSGGISVTHNGNFTLQSEDIATSGTYYSSGIFAVNNEPSKTSGALYIKHQDNDTTVYSSPNTWQGNGLVILQQGAMSGDNYVGQSKDMHGIVTMAKARNDGWTEKGVSGIVAKAYQYGVGVATNEFEVNNEASSSAQATDMKAVQGIVNANKGSSDGTHFYDVFFATCGGTGQCRSALNVTTSGGGGFLFGIDLSNVVFAGAPLRFGNNQALWTLNAAGTDNLSLIKANASNTIELGGGALNLTSDGNVGIGTTSPLATLDIRGNSSTTPIASFSGQTSFAGLVIDNKGSGDIFTASSSGLNRFVITQSGNVGIGTTSPNTKLHVQKGVAGTAPTWVTADVAIFENTAGTNSVLQLFTSNAASSNIGFSDTDARNQGIIGYNHSDDSLYFYANAGEKMRITSTGLVGIGTTSPLAKLDIRGAGSATSPIASLSGSTTFAGLVVDNSGSGDLFTASKSGATKFTILNNGNLSLAGTTNFLSTLASAATDIRTWTLPDASGTLCLQNSSSCGFATGTNYWQSANAGTIAPYNNTVDLLIGGTSTSSAKFAFLNVNSGTPTASISANSGNNALYLTGDGTLATTNRATLTIGNSSTYNTTGDILLNPNGTGSVGIGTTAPLAKLDVNGNLRVTGFHTDTPTATTSNAGLMSTSDKTKVSRWIDAKADYSINCDGTDETEKFQTLISNLTSGTTVVFPAGTCGYSSELTIGNGTNSSQGTIHNILLLGQGGSYYFSSGTIFKWLGGASSGTMLTLAGNADQLSIKGITFDANNAIANGVTVYSDHYGSLEDIGILNFTNTGLSLLTRVGSLPSHWTNYLTVKGFYIISQNNGITGLLVDGDYAGNADNWQNSFRDGIIQVPNASSGTNYAAHFKFTDSSLFENVELNTYGAGNGYAAWFDGTDNANYPQNLSFLNSSINSTKVTGTIGKNQFYGFKTRDSETIPTDSNLIGYTDTGQIFNGGISIFQGAVTGKALMTLNETGDQNIFTASASGATRFVITNGGLVGIGTSNPTKTLETVGQYPTIAMTGYTQGTAGFGIYQARSAQGTEAAPTALNSGNALGYYGFYGYGTNAWAGSATAAIYATAEDNFNNSSMGTNLMLATTPRGSINRAERLRIVSEGYIGINVSSPSAVLDVRGIGINTLSSTIPVASISGSTTFAGLVVDNSGSGDLFTASKSGATKFTVLNNGNVEIYGTATTCTIGNGTSATNCSSSDIRLKDDVSPLSEIKGLDAVRLLNPVSYKWNSWMQGNGSSSSDQFGFIAQDVASVFPNLVEQDKNTGYYKLDYQGFFAPLVKSIQELDVEVNNSGDLISNLALRVNTLEQQAGANASATLNTSNNLTIEQFNNLSASMSSQLSNLQSQVASLSSQLPTLQPISPIPSLATSGAQLTLDALDIRDATVSGTLSVLERTLLSDVGVTGTINAGMLTINGLDNNGLASINTLSGPLHLQSDGFNGLDILDGKVTIAENGNIKTQGNITAKEVAAETFKVLGSKSTGNAVLPAGQTEVEITAVVATNSAKILLTPTTLTDKILTIIEKGIGKFKVGIVSPASSDIKFDWFIIQ